MKIYLTSGVLLILATCLSAQTSAAHSAVQRQRELVEREHWQSAGRHVGSPSSALLRQQALAQKLRTRNLAVSATAAVSGAWVSLGPLPLPSDASGIGLQDYGWVTGRATAVAIDPNDLSGNTVFAGSAYGGVWKSTNAGNLSPSPIGVNWTPLTDDQATLAIGAIAIQPQPANPDPSKSVVLAATGETNSSGDSYYGLGILRSGDGGQTWTLISQDSTGIHNFAGIGFSQIAFSTTNPNLVIAAAAAATEGIVEGLENPPTSNRGCTTQPTRALHGRRRTSMMRGSALARLLLLLSLTMLQLVASTPRSAFTVFTSPRMESTGHVCRFSLVDS